MKLSLSTLAAALTGLAVLTLGSAVQAQTPGYTIDDTTTVDTLGNPPFTLGSQFTVNSNITVTSLGIFDSGLDGLTDSYPIGIFDSSGNLLASTTILSGTVDPLVNQFRYASIAPVALTAGGTYEVGAVYLTGDDGVIFPGDATNLATGAAITFDGATFATGSSLSAPLSADGTDGFFGPNFLYTSSAVPEPGTYAMLGSLGVTAAGFLRRKRAR